MKKFILIISWLFISFPVLAQSGQPEYQGEYNPNQNMQEYFQAAYPNYDKSIIYVFFNNNPCYQCPQAIEMIEQIYNQNYSNLYSLMLINYQNDREYNFIETYHLSRPLEVVLVKVDDGGVFGYKKLEDLNDMTSDSVSFTEYFTNQVNNFLSNS